MTDHSQPFSIPSLIIPMQYDSRQVANAFLELAEYERKQLTNMQLQKFVFLAQGFSLALRGEPITYHHIHAWQWGPVLPKIYKAFQKFGSGPILQKWDSGDDPIPSDSVEAGIIEGVWTKYGHMSGGALSKLTHEPGSPWEITWGEKEYGIIDPELMRAFYSKQINAG